MKSNRKGEAEKGKQKREVSLVEKGELEGRLNFVEKGRSERGLETC